MNIPTKLTVSRLILVPFFMFFLQNGMDWLALTIFVIASLTDFLDGYLARKWNQISDLGKLLDPLADKILVAAALIIFVELHIVPAWAVVIIIGRELFVSVMRAVLAAKGVVVAAGKIGKVKTATQMIAIIMILSAGAFKINMMLQIALVLFYISVALTAISGIEYYLKNRKHIIN